MFKIGIGQVLLIVSFSRSHEFASIHVEFIRVIQEQMALFLNFEFSLFEKVDEGGLLALGVDSFVLLMLVGGHVADDLFDDLIVQVRKEGVACEELRQLLQFQFKSVIQPKDYVFHINTQYHCWLKSNDRMGVYFIEAPCLISEALAFLKYLQELLILTEIAFLVGSMVVLSVGRKLPCQFADLLGFLSGGIHEQFVYLPLVDVFYHVTLVMILYAGGLPFQNEIDSTNIQLLLLYNFMLLELFQHGSPHDSLAELPPIDVAQLLQSLTLLDEFVDEAVFIVGAGTKDLLQDLEEEIVLKLTHQFAFLQQLWSEIGDGEEGAAWLHPGRVDLALVLTGHIRKVDISDWLSLHPNKFINQNSIVVEKPSEHSPISPKVEKKLSEQLPSAVFGGTILIQLFCPIPFQSALKRIKHSLHQQCHQ